MHPDLNLSTPHGVELARQLGLTLTASKKLDTHLTASIEALTPKKESKYAMRGLARLSNLSQTIFKQMDAEADAVADELVAAKAQHDETLGQFKGVATSIRQAADEATAVLGQISNMPPPTA